MRLPLVVTKFTVFSLTEVSAYLLNYYRYENLRLLLTHSVTLMHRQSNSVLNVQEVLPNVQCVTHFRPGILYNIPPYTYISNIEVYMKRALADIISKPMHASIGYYILHSSIYLIDGLHTKILLYSI